MHSCTFIYDSSRLTYVTVVFNVLELSLVHLLLDILSLSHDHGKARHISLVVKEVNSLKSWSFQMLLMYIFVVMFNSYIFQLAINCLL